MILHIASQGSWGIFCKFGDANGIHTEVNQNPEVIEPADVDKAQFIASAHYWCCL